MPDDGRSRSPPNIMDRYRQVFSRNALTSQVPSRLLWSNLLGPEQWTASEVNAAANENWCSAYCLHLLDERLRVNYRTASETSTSNDAENVRSSRLPARNKQPQQSGFQLHSWDTDNENEARNNLPKITQTCTWNGRTECQIKYYHLFSRHWWYQMVCSGDGFQHIMPMFLLSLQSAEAACWKLLICALLYLTRTSPN